MCGTYEAGSVNVIPSLSSLWSAAADGERRECDSQPFLGVPPAAGEAGCRGGEVKGDVVSWGGLCCNNC